MSWFVSDIRTPNSAVSICLYIFNIKYISSDLQLGKLKENDSRLGLRNIFWVCESLSSQKVFL